MRTLLVPAPLHPGPISILGEEARHGAAVLRLRPGDEVRLADGAGRAGRARVAQVGREGLRLDVDAVEEIPAGPAAALTVACAVPRGDRMADIVRGLTELGVGAVLPLACERSVRMGGLERLQRVAAEALKQCRRGHLPRIGPLVEIPTLGVAPGRLILLDRDGGPAQPGPAEPTTLVIGPEGGFTPAERDRLLAMGATAVRIAAPVLRIETAAIAAAAVWTAAWETPRP